VAGVFPKNFIVKENTFRKRGKPVLLNIVTEIHKCQRQGTGKGKAQAKARHGGRSFTKKFAQQKRNTWHKEGRPVLLNIVTEIHKCQRQGTGKGKAWRPEFYKKICAAEKEHMA
jgi:hypothetical protein